MKKEIKCKECGNTYIENYICDNCGKELDLGIPIFIKFGYGHNLDDEERYFCNNNCTIEYLQGLEQWIN